MTSRRSEDYEVRIVRAQRSSEDPYFATRRANAQDRALTFEARGLLWYLLSKPDDWRVMISDLEQQCGRDKVYRILKELQASGHLVRTKQARSGKGRFGKLLYTIFEAPPEASPRPALPDTDSPYTAEPCPANPPLQNKEETEKREAPQKTEESPAPAARPAQPHVALIEAWWAAIPEAVRPPGKAPIPRHVAAAKLMLSDGFTPERITAFVSSTYPSYLAWAKKHDAPALMGLEHVKSHLKAWEAKKDAPAQPRNRSSVTEHNRDILDRALAKLQAGKEKGDGQS